MLRCASDTVLNLGTHHKPGGMDTVDGLSIAIGHESDRRSIRESSRESADIKLRWDSEEKDIPLIMKLVGQSLNNLTRKEFTLGSIREKHRGFVGLPQLQIGMRLGLVQNLSRSLPALHRVSFVADGGDRDREESTVEQLQGHHINSHIIMCTSHNDVRSVHSAFQYTNV